MRTEKKATRPNEIICFMPIELNTIKEAKVYMFMVMDVYSEFMFQAGVERGDDMEYILKQIQQLLNNKDFNKHKDQPFTLVMSGFEEYRREIEKLIKPHGGKMVVDSAYVKREMKPAVDSFLATLAKSH